MSASTPSSSSEDPQQLNTLEILYFLWKWKWHLVISAVLGLVISLIVSLQLTPAYESQTVLLPAATTSPEKTLADQQFGVDFHAERLIQILQSDAIRDSVVEKFDLIAHYGIDTGEEDWQYQLWRQYQDKIHFEKTIYAAIVIRVRDEDPELAAQIANEIARLLEVVRKDIFRTNTQAALEVLREDYQNKQAEILALRDSIFSIQTSRLNEQERLHLGKVNQLKNSIRSLESRLEKIRSDLNVFDYGEQINILNRQISNAQAVVQWEEGRLETYAQTEGVADSLIIKSQARLSGARKQVTLFQTQLQYLTRDNPEYSQLIRQLDSEIKLLESHEKAYESMIFDPARLENDPQLAQLKNSYTFQSDLLDELQLKYQQALNRTEEPLPATYLVSKASASYRKVFPKLTLILPIGTLFPFLLMIGILLLWEKIKSFRELLEATP